MTQGVNASLYDIVSGSNNLTPNICNVCTANIGYDAVTGLGVPMVSRLFATYLRDAGWVRPET